MSRQGMVVLAVIVSGALAWPSAEPQSGGRIGTGRVTTDARCVANLGMGQKSGRRFCDVIIAQTAVESVAMVVPARAGPATLRFDLHNRFVVSDARRPPAEAFERHAALVAIVTGAGEEIVRAAVTREYRTIEDVFDRISGGGRDAGLKAVAPGGAEAVVAILPEGVTSIGIVGVNLERVSAGGREMFDAPGRPVALASNFRIEYTPR
ncbi:MAG TPA: hypothetical protein VMM93_09910 [Vicinamibacterales bacterium]|nr:hypothetical protein [Vicinamibacterales bacterium]